MEQLPRGWEPPSGNAKGAGNSPHEDRRQALEREKGRRRLEADLAESRAENARLRAVVQAMQRASGEADDIAGLPRAVQQRRLALYTCKLAQLERQVTVLARNVRVRDHYFDEVDARQKKKNRMPYLR